MSSSDVCVICGDDATQSPLLRAPCGRHAICAEDLAEFFRNATKDESMYPPHCCDAIFLHMDYEQDLPFEVSWEYQLKENGEYKQLKKFRVYCANNSCAKYLRPDSHMKDEEHNVTYATCEEGNCGRTTCITCKTLLTGDPAGHVCEVAEIDKLFKEKVEKERYQECYVCGSTIELAEACNHISCECGADFCYICGKPWSGLHGCPQYGPAEYDDESYNQDGFHIDTGLNRDGLTRAQQRRQDREEEGDEEDEEDEDEDEGIPPWVDDENRTIFRILPWEEREEAVAMLRIQLAQQGIFHEDEPEQRRREDEDTDGEDDEEDEAGEGEGLHEDEVDGNGEGNIINVDENRDENAHPDAEGSDQGPDNEIDENRVIIDFYNEHADDDEPAAALSQSQISAAGLPLPDSRPDSVNSFHDGTATNGGVSSPVLEDLDAITAGQEAFSNLHEPSNVNMTHPDDWTQGHMYGEPVWNFSHIFDQVSGSLPIPPHMGSTSDGDLPSSILGDFFDDDQVPLPFGLGLSHSNSPSNSTGPSSSGPETEQDTSPMDIDGPEYGKSDW